jgi:hypothetical protein
MSAPHINVVLNAKLRTTEYILYPVTVLRGSDGWSEAGTLPEETTYPATLLGAGLRMSSSVL